MEFLTLLVFAVIFTALVGGLVIHNIKPDPIIKNKEVTQPIVATSSNSSLIRTIIVCVGLLILVLTTPKKEDFVNSNTKYCIESYSNYLIFSTYSLNPKFGDFSTWNANYLGILGNVVELPR